LLPSVCSAGERTTTATAQRRSAEGIRPNVCTAAAEFDYTHNTINNYGLEATNQQTIQHTKLVTKSHSDGGPVSTTAHSAMSPLADSFIPAARSNVQPLSINLNSLSFCYLNARSLLAIFSDGVMVCHVLNICIILPVWIIHVILS
jgi:hypothetical protein